MSTFLNLMVFYSGLQTVFVSRMTEKFGNRWLRLTIVITIGS